MSDKKKTSKRNIILSAAGGVVLGALATGLPYQTIVVHNKNEHIAQREAFWRGVDADRVSNYNGLVGRFNNLLENKKEVDLEKSKLSSTLQNTRYVLNNTRQELDSVKGAYNVLEAHLEGVNLLLSDANERGDSLEVVIKDVYAKKEGVKMDLLASEKNRANMERAYVDTVNTMQESIYGLLASPWWTASPRPDRNNVPNDFRFIPKTRDDVLEYRRSLNREQHNN